MENKLYRNRLLFIQQKGNQEILKQEIIHLIGKNQLSEDTNLHMSQANLLSATGENKRVDQIHPHLFIIF